MEARTETWAARDKLDKDEIQLVANANADNAFAMGQGFFCAAYGKRSGLAKGDMKRSKLLRATPEGRGERERHTLWFIYVLFFLFTPISYRRMALYACIEASKCWVFLPHTAYASVVRVSDSLVGTRGAVRVCAEMQSVGGRLARGCV